VKFLVTGGLGYIGQVLQEELKKAGHEVDIIDNDLYSLHEWGDKLDILSKDNLEKIGERIKNADVVLNLAAIVGDQACLVDTRKAIQINCQGVQNIVKLCNEHGKKIIHGSTCSLYGATEGLLTEDSQTFPVDFYGQTKYQQERFVIESAKDFCIFRFGTAYGHSSRMRYDLVVNTFTIRALHNEKLTVFGGDQWRPFVHIRDMARAMIFAAEKDLKGIFNLANENLTITQVAELIAKMTGVEVEVNKMMGDPRNYRVDSKKLLETGFTYEWTVEKGVKDMLEKCKGDDYNKEKFSNHKMMLSIKK